MVRLDLARSGRAGSTRRARRRTRAAGTARCRGSARCRRRRTGPPRRRRPRSRRGTCSRRPCRSRCADLRRADRAQPADGLRRCRRGRRRAAARPSAPSSCRGRCRRSASRGRARRSRSPRARAVRTRAAVAARCRCPPSRRRCRATAAGVAGTAVKNGTAMSGMSVQANPGRSVPGRLPVVRGMPLHRARRRPPTISTRSSRRSRVAFHNDPVWSWAFPDARHARRAVPPVVAAVRGERAAARLHVDDAERPRRSRCGRRPACPSSPTRPRRAIPPLLDELLGERARGRARRAAPVRGRAPARRAALLPRLRRDARRPPRARASASSCSRRTSR